MPRQICFCLWEWSTLCVFNALGSKIKWIHKTSYCHSLGRGGLAIKNSCSDERYGRHGIRIMKLIRGLYVKLSINNTYHLVTLIITMLFHYSEYLRPVSHFFILCWMSVCWVSVMLNVVMPSIILPTVIMLSVMALCYGTSTTPGHHHPTMRE
jgi:hypothetical protein